jgi:DNA-binding NarL/FixJ family response regulator
LKDELDRCLQAGCSSCLSKPVDFPLLLKTVRSAVPEGTRLAKEEIAALPQPQPATQAIQLTDVFFREQGSGSR